MDQPPAPPVAKYLVFADGTSRRLADLTEAEYLQVGNWNGSSDVAYQQYLQGYGMHELDSFDPEELRTAKVRVYSLGEDVTELHVRPTEVLEDLPYLPLRDELAGRPPVDAPTPDHEYRPSQMTLYRHGFEHVRSEQAGIILYRRSAPVGSHDVRISAYSFSLHAEKTGEVRLHGLYNVRNDDDFDTLLRLIGW